LGYGAAHVPSTLLTMKFGARWWYGTMTISWGIVATAAAAIKNRNGLIVQRLLLGVAEAGGWFGYVCEAHRGRGGGGFGFG
jgi:Na+/H+ antiporter NhaC